MQAWAFINMEMVCISMNPADDEDPVIETFDVYNHLKTYNQMMMIIKLNLYFKVNNSFLVTTPLYRGPFLGALDLVV